MSTKKKQRKLEKEQRELTRKEVRARAKDRARNRKIYTWIGAAIGVALIAILVGVVVEFLITPNSVVAKVGDETIITKDFRRRTLLQQGQLVSQLSRYLQLEQQFGGQGFFQNQISQIQSTLGSPFTLGISVLDQMINEKVILREAEKRSIVISDEEINEALREEVAANQGFITVPQATETAAAAVEQTATAESYTPTPSPTVDISSTVGISATATLTPTLTPTPVTIMDEDGYQTGVATLEARIDEISGMSISQYREVIHARLADEKLREAIGEELVEETEKQVNARHILMRPREPTPTPTPVPEGEDTPVPTPEPTALSEGDPTPTPTLAPRTREETLAAIEDVRRQITDDGADFAELAAEYSEDQSNASDGGDLGWFGPGRMVPEFEEVAFSLEIGQVSEPVSTTFGYHLIEVLEIDETRPKDEAQLEQERAQAYQEWLQEQVQLTEIDRPEDLESKLPARLRRDLEPIQPLPQQPVHSGM